LTHRVASTTENIGRIGLPSVAAICLPAALLLLAVAAACGSSDGSVSTLSGSLEIDGSSTVFPISEAAAEEFREVHPKVRVNVGASGTGGGFKRFVVGELDILDASRPIKQAEIDSATRNGVVYTALDVAIDGLTVVVHPRNDFIDCITVEELELIWSPGPTIDRWNQVRPEWPDKPLHLYGPDTDSGTFDFFTEVIVGQAQASRPDYFASASDNFLVQGIYGDRNSLGYFGFAYYIANVDKLKAVAVDNGEGCILPTIETIRADLYQPLVRPLLLYVNNASLSQPEVLTFLDFYMDEGSQLVEEVGYIPLSDAEYADNKALLASTASQTLTTR
jgi:phosphate transport system substrate-binding protein